MLSVSMSFVRVHRTCFDDHAFVSMCWSVVQSMSMLMHVCGV